MWLVIYYTCFLLMLLAFLNFSLCSKMYSYLGIEIKFHLPSLILIYFQELDVTLTPPSKLIIKKDTVASSVTQLPKLYLQVACRGGPSNRSPALTMWLEEDGVINGNNNDVMVITSGDGSAPVRNLGGPSAEARALYRKLLEETSERTKKRKPKPNFDLQKKKIEEMSNPRKITPKNDKKKVKTKSAFGSTVVASTVPAASPYSVLMGGAMSPTRGISPSSMLPPVVMNSRSAPTTPGRAVENSMQAAMTMVDNRKTDPENSQLIARLNSKINKLYNWHLMEVDLGE
jgi:hypothetical protein